MRVLAVVLAVTLWLLPTEARAERYALSLFHFNVQYVAGDPQLERRILSDSLQPLLEQLRARESWRVDIEIQGYGIEIMAAEYPDMLLLLKSLVDRGQVELIVTHYSDQWFIGYPEEDLVRSVAESDRILKAHGLKRSRVFSGQEMQWAPWTLRALDEQYDVFLTSACFSHYHTRDTTLYDGGAGNWVFGAGGSKALADTEWTWAFYDDGENWNTLTTVNRFKYFKVRETMNTREFEKLEQDGWKFATITEYLDILKSAKHQPPALPFSVEGTWQMGNSGPWMWMGRRTTQYEEDGLVRGAPSRAREALLLAETLLEGWHGERQRELWRRLWLSEVSDSSGWRPEKGEVTYTLDEAAAVESGAAALIGALALPAPLVVNTRLGRVKALDEALRTTLQAAEWAENPPMMPVLTVEKGTGALTSFRLAPGIFRIEAKLAAQGAKPWEYRLTLPVDAAHAALRRDDGEAVALPPDPKVPYELPLPNGYLRLSERWVLIKDCSARHLSGRLDPQAGSVTFHEQLNGFTRDVAFSWYLVEGQPDLAWRLARALNLRPYFVVARGPEGTVFRKIGGAALAALLRLADDEWQPPR